MTTSASATSISSPDSLRISATRPATPPAGMSTTFTVVSPAAPAWGAAGAKTFGRRVAMAGVDLRATVTNAFPAYTGRVNSSRPPAVTIFVQSEAIGTPSFAASRGARSLPIAVAAKKTASGRSPSTSSFRASA